METYSPRYIKKIPIRNKCDIAITAGDFNCRDNCHGDGMARWCNYLLFQKKNTSIAIDCHRETFAGRGSSAAPDRALFLPPERADPACAYGDIFDKLRNSWRSSRNAFSDNNCILYPTGLPKLPSMPINCATGRYSFRTIAPEERMRTMDRMASTIKERAKDIATEK